MVLIAFVGRPNVGKSSLFNKLVQKKIAIVDEREGVTRDRIYAKAVYNDQTYTAVDTGGIDFASEDPLQGAIAKQATEALIEADLVIFVVDGATGITVQDQAIATRLHREKKATLVAVNKCDRIEDDSLVHPFSKLGFENMVATSALYDQVDSLFDRIFSMTSDLIMDEKLESGEKIPKVAILGRPNVGKSSLINALLNEERVITSDVAGTTRDAVDIMASFQDQAYCLIDTAGIRRKKVDQEPLDYFSRLRTEMALKRSDIALLVLDAEAGFTVQERHIAASIEKAQKGCLLLINKWDLIHGFRMEHCIKALHSAFPSFSHVPILFVSAKSKQNVNKIFPAALDLYSTYNKRIPTAQLNRFLEDALARTQPPAIGGKRLRIYYMTQVDVGPPQFILFVNQAALLADTYKKYLINCMREAFKLYGVPIILDLKEKEARYAKAVSGTA